MNDLSKQTCVPCQGGVPKMAGEELREYSAKLADWKVVDEHHLEREFPFPDFVTALAYVNRIGELSEEQNHHPDIFLSWGVVRITVWTHKSDGLTANDFIYAAKCDELYASQSA